MQTRWPERTGRRRPRGGTSIRDPSVSVRALSHSIGWTAKCWAILFRVGTNYQMANDSEHTYALLPRVTCDSPGGTDALPPPSAQGMTLGRRGSPAAFRRSSRRSRASIELSESVAGARSDTTGQRGTMPPPLEPATVRPRRQPLC
jgi:hypothetical protein